MGKPPTRPKLLEFLINHPNKPVSREQISRGTGLTPKQVLDGMRHIAQDETLNVTAVVRGQWWRYDDSSNVLPSQDKVDSHSETSVSEFLPVERSTIAEAMGDSVNLSPKMGDVFEVIGVMPKTGRVLVRDNRTGIVYTATEME